MRATTKHFKPPITKEAFPSTFQLPRTSRCSNSTPPSVPFRLPNPILADKITPPPATHTYLHKHLGMVLKHRAALHHGSWWVGTAWWCSHVMDYLHVPGPPSPFYQRTPWHLATPPADAATH